MLTHSGPRRGQALPRLAACLLTLATLTSEHAATEALPAELVPLWTAAAAKKAGAAELAREAASAKRLEQLRKKRAVIEARAKQLRQH